MLQQLWRIEVPISRNPCSRKIRTICQQAKVSNEPHPVCTECESDGHGNHDAENGAAPKCHKRMRIRFEEAIGEVPGE